MKKEEIKKYLKNSQKRVPKIRRNIAGPTEFISPIIFYFNELSEYHQEFEILLFNYKNNPKKIRQRTLLKKINISSSWKDKSSWSLEKYFDGKVQTLYCSFSDFKIVKDEIEKFIKFEEEYKYPSNFQLSPKIAL